MFGVLCWPCILRSVSRKTTYIQACKNHNILGFYVPPTTIYSVVYAIRENLTFHGWCSIIMLQARHTERQTARALQPLFKNLIAVLLPIVLAWQKLYLCGKSGLIKAFDCVKVRFLGQNCSLINKYPSMKAKGHSTAGKRGNCAIPYNKSTERGEIEKVRQWVVWSTDGS